MALRRFEGFKDEESHQLFTDIDGAQPRRAPHMVKMGIKVDHER
jgi:hypothetical protein